MTEKVFTFGESSAVPDLDMVEFPPDARSFREVRYVKKKNGQEMIITRMGFETWLPVTYYEKVVENNRKKMQEGEQHE